MIADKRSVFTDALVTLGTIHNVAEGTRDAVHIAARVCKAGQILIPGMRIGRLPDGRYGTGKDVKIVGLVDPFLDPDTFIMEDQVFWLTVMPRQITSLQHVWKHPDFPPDLTSEQIAVAKMVAEKELAEANVREHAEKVSEAETWLDLFWPQVDCDSYQHLLQIADDFVESGYHLVEGGRWESARSVMWDNQDKFWDSYELVRGVKLTSEQRGGIFCCSC